MHEDCPDEQLIIGTKCADFAEKMAEAIAARVEHLVRMLCNKVSGADFLLLLMGVVVVVAEVIWGTGGDGGFSSNRCTGTVFNTLSWGSAVCIAEDGGDPRGRGGRRAEGPRFHSQKQ